jgi:uncharacterized membrane protein
MDRLRSVWETLRSSLWFMPTLMVLGAVLLAVALIDAESFVNRERLAQEWPRLFGAGAEGARGMLSAIAGSMITVAGVVFSITTVSFTLAASQYTSRILRTFMSDRGSQAVLGVFLGVFAYCLVVLRTIRGGDEGVFVPTLAVLGAFLLALVAIGFLVYFIHHVASSIQASVIIHSVTHETLDTVDRLYPERAAGAAEEPPLQDTLRVSVPSQKTGYIQALNRELLLRSAREQNTVIRMERGVGEFVFEGLPLASVSDGHAGRELVGHINSACVVGRHATMQQDVAFGIRQIVDIALKALSPGINDTTTAIICLDHLGAILARLAGRELGPSHLSDPGGVRVLLRTSSYSEYVTMALAQIREHARGNAAVLARLLEVLSLIAPHAPPHRRHALEVQRDAVLESVERTVPAPEERRQIHTAAERLAGVLRQVSP